LTIPAGVWTSTKFPNILSTLQGLDPTFTYYGHVGALKLETQDPSYRIQAAIRTLNGDYSKTFPGLAFVPSNCRIPDIARHAVPNLSNNAVYRSAADFCLDGR
jgi:hypothetical protein